MAVMVETWLPDDLALLAAIGRVAVLQAQLDYGLRMTVKSLEGMDVGSALRDTEMAGSKDLKKRIKRLARKRIGSDDDALKQLCAILERARRATERRNTLLHGFWCKKPDGEPGIRTEHGPKPRAVEFRPIPTIPELEALASELDQIADDLNSARLKGFLRDALGANC
jgi:hypothetical protein